jgi:hypothetical protein
LFLDKYLEKVLESQHALSRHIVEGVSSQLAKPVPPAQYPGRIWSFGKDGEPLRERYQGQSLNRLEDLRFLTGRGRYVANDHVANVLHAYVVRSPHAFARIVRMDLAAARTVPGVVAVLSEADLAADGIGELPCVTIIDAVEPILGAACWRSRRLHHCGVAGSSVSGRRSGGHRL